MRWLLGAYHSALHRYPFVVQSVQTGILVATGDVLSQVIVEENSIKTLDSKRTMQYFCVGAFYFGPILTVWYRVLQKYVGTEGKWYGLTKMSIDQCCFAPVFLAGFTVTAVALQGKSLQEIKDKFNEVYFDILFANYKVWPAVQLVNFYLIPLHYQVLFVQVISLFWNTYLCYKTKPNKAA